MARQEKKYHYIYKITNVLNNKYYIGMHSTDNLKDGYFGSGHKLADAKRYYGIHNFKKDILEFLPNRSSLKKREKYLVNEDLLKDPLCMNLMHGGIGGFISDEQQLRRSIAGVAACKRLWKENGDWAKKNRQRSSRTMSRLHKQGKINYNTFSGKSHTSETIQKMKDSHAGSIPWNKGKLWSKKVKNKISKRLKGNIPWNKKLNSYAG
ncbi:MAG: NUMOD3 domain-containing DNA-binding protein [Methanogenium sp.]|jgi:group I intron endonuclease